CEALARSPNLPGLRRLELPRNRIGDAGAEALACSPHLRLERLSLLANALGPAGAEALADSDLLAGLRALDLSYNDVGAGVRALAGADLASLRVLELSGLHFDRASAEAFAELPSFPRLRALLLRGPRELTDVLATFAESPLLATLTHLDLADGQLGVEGA